MRPSDKVFSGSRPNCQAYCGFVVLNENDIHSSGMVDDFGLAVNLDVSPSIKLLPVNQQRDPRVTFNVFDLICRISRE